MLAALLTAERPRLTLENVPDPVAGPGEVILRVSGCGICGSDLHLASQLAPVGGILGHELAGTIELIGKGVNPALAPLGAAAVARPLWGCGECEWCRHGRPDHCRDFGLVGLERPGAFAEYVRVRADELFLLPDGIPSELHPLVEPLAVARRALRRGAVSAGDRVAVLGAGPIGLAVVGWARALGVDRIAVTDPCSDRRRLAIEMGATSAIDPTSGTTDVELTAALEGAPQVVMECTGRAGLIQEAMGLASVDGRVVVVGICPSVDEFVPWSGISKELDVRFAVYYGREDFVDTISALEANRLQVSQFVTEHIDLEALPERFLQLCEIPDGGKVIVHP